MLKKEKIKAILKRTIAPQPLCSSLTATPKDSEPEYSGGRHHDLPRFMLFGILYLLSMILDVIDTRHGKQIPRLSPEKL